MFSSSNAHIEILIDSQDVILRGSEAEAAGALLRGKLVMVLDEPMKVKSVTLQCNGKMKVEWKEAKDKSHQVYLLFREEKTVLEHEWVFLEPHRYHNLAKGKYSWDFELRIPGSIPETVETNRGANVWYRLKAVVERPSLFSNLVAKLPLRVVRVPVIGSNELTQSILYENQWKDKVAYEIDLPLNTYELGGKIPITLRLTMLCQELRVKNIACTLTERITMRAQNNSHTVELVLRVVEVDPSRFLQISSCKSWEQTLEVNIPTASKYAHYDCTISLIRIRHELNFFITLQNKDKLCSQICVSLPISIIARTEELCGELPSYDESFGTLPYYPSATETPLYSLGEQTVEQPQERPIRPYDHNILMRLPSYRTAIQEAPISFPLENIPGYS
ncbi:uncharacterized protein VTP21DRAFT_11206 [Calcarisporiella thermophila]|uniref:uncharacterized protein n=1 Tax=Calcarisporiella thermophila TaxID=911321 RepID=UPI0037430A08